MQVGLTHGKSGRGDQAAVKFCASSNSSSKIFVVHLRIV